MNSTIFCVVKALVKTARYYELSSSRFDNGLKNGLKNVNMCLDSALKLLEIIENEPKVLSGAKYDELLHQADILSHAANFVVNSAIRKVIGEGYFVSKDSYDSLVASNNVYKSIR